MSFDSQRVLICVAWPYANGPLHLGHVAGAYLPADIFAKYCRQLGKPTLVVSGSDTHGTPIMVKAENEGRHPRDVVDESHALFLKLWSDLGIDFDLFTSTSTQNHSDVVQGFLSTLNERGYIYQAESEQYFDAVRHRFLPDRYVEGTCPKCGSGGARGDQCDGCGSTLDPTDLIDPVSKLSGEKPVLKSTTHLYFKLSSLEEELAAWIASASGWRKHVKQWSRSFVTSGLRDRAVTRDLEWGVAIPPEFGIEPQKRVYVWFEAVMGYLSATIESQGTPGWEEWWKGHDVESFYFIGKDNIPFHTVIWPAMLMAHGSLNLPTVVAANQYVVLGGKKASKSSGVGRTAEEYLQIVSADALRFALSCVLPENSDTELDDDEIAAHINSELVNGWGNLVNRTFSMLLKNGGVLGQVGDSAEDVALLDRIDAGIDEAGHALSKVEIRRAHRALMECVKDVNVYVSVQEPWKQDIERSAEIVAVAFAAVVGIAASFMPFIPASSGAVLRSAGVDPATVGWGRPELERGLKVGALGPLFERVETPFFG